MKSTLAFPESPAPGSPDFQAEICRRAAAVFYRKGVAAASMAELVSEACLQGGLNYYIKGKRGLLFAILSRALNRCTDDAVEPARTEDLPARRFVRLLRGYIEVWSGDFESMALLFTTADALTEDHRTAIEQRLESLVAFFESCVVPLLGSERSIEPKLAVSGTLERVHEAIRRHRREGPPENDEASRQILQLALEGLGTGPETLDEVIDILA